MAAKKPKPTRKPTPKPTAAPPKPAGPPPDLTGFLTGDIGPSKPKPPKVIPFEPLPVIPTVRASSDPAPEPPAVEPVTVPGGAVGRANCDPPSRT